MVCLATPQGWPASSESVAGLRRNQWPEWIGITGRFASEYADRYGGMGVIGFYWVYAGILEYLQQFSPGRHVSIWDFVAWALGALCGVLASTLFVRTIISRSNG